MKQTAEPGSRSPLHTLAVVVILAAAPSSGAGPPATVFDAAAGAVATGDLEGALDRLEEIFAAGHPTPSEVLADPRFTALREDAPARARLRELLRAHARENRITMVAPAEPGEPMLVRGRVLAAPGGEPIAGAHLEIYHTDATGHYEPGETVGRDANSRLFGFVRTDSDGRFELRTIKPAPYPGASEGAAHVHFIAAAEGFRRYGADFRPYDNPATAAERATALERAWRYSTVRREGDLLVCEVMIPMRRSGSS